MPRPASAKSSVRLASGLGRELHAAVLAREELGNGREGCRPFAQSLGLGELLCTDEQSTEGESRVVRRSILSISDQRTRQAAWI